MIALIVDFIRRNKFKIGFAAMQVVLLCRSAWERSSWLDEIAVPLVLATMLSTGASEWFAAREFRQLPVSRRTVWLAQWWLAVPLSSLLMVSAVHLAMWSRRPSGWSLDGTALALVYCIAYTGAIRAFFTTSLARRGDEPATLGNLGGWMLAVLGIVAAPAVFGPYLPHHYGEVGPVTAVVLVVCLALAIRGYRYNPPIVARPYLRAARVPPPPAAQPYAAPEILSDEERAKRKERIRALPIWFRALMLVLGLRADESKRTVADSLEGFRLLAWLEGRRDLIAAVVTILFLVFVRMFGLFDEDGIPPWRTFAGTMGFLPFSHSPGKLADTMAIGGFGFFVSMASHGRVDHLRLLRALPFSTHQLIWRIVGLAAVSGAAIWASLLALHLLSTWSLPVSPRIDVFVAATAMMTMLSAIRLATIGLLGRLPLPQIAIALPCALWYAAFTRPLGSPAFSAFLASGLVAGIAYGVMRIAITRSARIYRPAPTGMAAL